MKVVKLEQLPPRALLAAYAGRGYTDCYVVQLDRVVSHAEIVEAFYTTALFKLERLLLAWLVHKPSTDAQAQSLARGEADSFAAWRVEARAPAQLLMCDYRNATRSWLLAESSGDGAAAGTRLYFGSAVVASKRGFGGAPRLGAGFRLLLGFHKLYSRMLLRAAYRRLLR